MWRSITAGVVREATTIDPAGSCNTALTWVALLVARGGEGHRQPDREIGAFALVSVEY